MRVRAFNDAPEGPIVIINAAGKTSVAEVLAEFATKIGLPEYTGSMKVYRGESRDVDTKTLDDHDEKVRIKDTSISVPGHLIVKRKDVASAIAAILVDVTAAKSEAKGKAEGEAKKEKEIDAKMRRTFSIFSSFSACASLIVSRTGIYQGPLPPLGAYRPGGVSASSINPYPHVNPVVKTLGQSPITWVHDFSTLSSIRQPRDMTYSNEADVEALVLLALTDFMTAVAEVADNSKPTLVIGEWNGHKILLAINKEKENDMIKSLHDLGIAVKSQERILGGLRPDIYVVVTIDENGQAVPVGVCVVKMPDADSVHADLRDVNNPAVLGQLYAYLMVLKTSYGVRHPFGIVTTYRRWRFGWLSDSDEIAASTANFKVNKSQAKPPTDLRILQQSQMLATARTTSNATPVAVASNLQLHVSKIYTERDYDLVAMIASVVLKMCSSERQTVEILSKPDRLVVSKAVDNMFFESLPFKSDDFRLGPVENNSKKIFLLYDLGRGRDGRVWLGATSGGFARVVKFLKYRSRDPKETEHAVSAGKNEASRWLLIWRLHAFSDIFARKVAVVMPYIQPIAKETWQQIKASQWKEYVIRGVVAGNGKLNYADDFF